MTETRVATPDVVLAIKKEEVVGAINDLQAEGGLEHAQARIAAVAIEQLEGDQAIAAQRAIVDGADPFLLELLLRGSVSEPIRTAHHQGPASLEGEARWWWLTLASRSWDEASVENATVLDKLQHLWKSLAWLARATDEEMHDAAQAELHKILATPYKSETVAGVELVRVYRSDRGFAAAYWDASDPQAYACVELDDGVRLLASAKDPLEERGFESTGWKVKAPQFWVWVPPSE